MSDIVERLRWLYPTRERDMEAAAEIKRLRGQIASYEARDASPRVVPIVTWSGGIAWAIKSGGVYLRPDKDGKLLEVRLPYTFGCQENARAALEATR